MVKQKHLHHKQTALTMQPPLYAKVFLGVRAGKEFKLKQESSLQIKLHQTAKMANHPEVAMKKKP